MKNPFDSSESKGKATIQDSMHGLANVLAFIATFLAFPAIYDLTQDVVREYLQNSFDMELLSEFGVWVWVGLASGAVFYVCRIAIFLSVVIIGERLLVAAF